MAYNAANVVQVTNNGSIFLKAIRRTKSEFSSDLKSANGVGYRMVLTELHFLTCCVDPCIRFS